MFSHNLLARRSLAAKGSQFSAASFTEILSIGMLDRQPFLES